MLHIIRLAQNLFSMSKLIYAGMQVVFYDARYKMVRGAMVIARGVKFGTLYKLYVCTIECNIISVKSKSMNTSLEEL